jgi:diguanylate cyclase (GGDEF)-like protein
VRRRASLTRYFVVVSLVAMTVLGLTLMWVSTNVMRQQAVRLGTVTATTISSYAVSTLTAEQFRTGVVDGASASDVAASVAGFDDAVVELRLWSTDGRLMFSTAANTTTGLPDTTRFADVMATGEADAQLTTAVRGGDDITGTTRPVLDVYVPVAAGDTSDRNTEVGPQDTDTVVGVAEVILDQTASQQAVSEAVRTVALVVVAGLGVLWLLLFRTVHSTSRRLHTTALENARLALLDSLTGLPNRRLLADRMRRSIQAAQDDGTRVGLVLLDIDRFKDINDTLGHDRGDVLLEQVADRLRNCLRDEDLVARLGGDEFAILLPDVRTVANAARLARRVRSVFVAPFSLGGMELHVETSVGVACLPDHADDASSLMRTADVAMYAAKVHRTGVSVYDPEEDHSSPARLQLLGDLHRALETQVSYTARTTRIARPVEEPAAPAAPAAHALPARELEMYYQPKIDLTSGRTVGYEALMRWRHPDRGLLLPSVFIPLAEQSGLIHTITAFALEEVVRQLAAWHAEGRNTPVAVNLSAHDVANDTVVDLIEHLLADYDVPSNLLEVEITETALIADTSRVVPVLDRLGALGVRVAIDDFGIGNTSIAQLRELPVNELKIDRLFVSDLADDSREGAQLVVQAMVDLAHSFGLRVVAEGVEDEGTASVLGRLGVDQAQGFFYAHPSPPSEVANPSARRGGAKVRRVRTAQPDSSADRVNDGQGAHI